MRSKQNRLELKDRILATAYRLFMAYGIRSVTMDDIARELSISKKTIYQHFKDKNEIVSKVTAMHLDKEEKEICKIVKEAQNSLHMLFLLSKCIRKNVVTLHPSLLFDLQKYHNNAWNIFMAYKERVFKNTFIEALRKGIEEGYFRKGIDPKVLATMRMEQVQMPFNDRIFPRDEYNFSEVQMQLFDHFVHGVLTPRGQRLFSNYLDNNYLNNNNE